MKAQATKENSLYLTIKQTYFDQIIDGTKDREYREIKDTTFKKYLDTDEQGDLYISDELPEDADIDISMYNNSQYPFFPRPYEYLSLAVGYNKDRDTAIVEVKDISFEVQKDKGGKESRFFWTDEDPSFIIDPNGDMAIWQIVYHLGEVSTINRKKK